MNIFGFGALGAYRPPTESQVPAQGAADRAAAKAGRVEDQLGRAFLTMQAMWTLLQDKLGVTDEELRERIIELDLSDGILDGKVRKPPYECTSCQRPTPRRFNRCLYCTADIEMDPF